MKRGPYAGRYIASAAGIAGACLLFGCASSADRRNRGGRVGQGREQRGRQLGNRRHDRRRWHDRRSRPDGGFGPSGDGGVCSSALADRVRIMEIDVGAAYAYNEVDNNGAALGLTPLAISPVPSGGSRLAFLEKGASSVYVVTLDADDG